MAAVTTFKVAYFLLQFMLLLLFVFNLSVNFTTSSGKWTQNKSHVYHNFFFRRKRLALSIYINKNHVIRKYEHVYDFGTDELARMVDEKIRAAISTRSAIFIIDAIQFIYRKKISSKYMKIWWFSFRPDQFNWYVQLTSRVLHDCNEFL